jgi:hypothetical protein
MKIATLALVVAMVAPPRPNCGAETKRLLFTVGAMVVYAATENPLGFFLSAIALADGIHAYGECKEGR